jgi:hypothetical protein
MEIAVASARASSSQQVNNVEQLVPSQLRQGAENLIDFLEDYYKHLNTTGLPSREISEIASEQDIDRGSSLYLDLIQKEIAKNIPRSIAFDRTSLYKKIVNYYITKGSEDSIINFFKIFYDEVISITYPRERIFRPSAGNYNGTEYLDTKGFLSNSNVLQDSTFWQDFSYVINTSIQASEWSDKFRQLAHPAGFRFFVSLVLLLVKRSNWVGRFVEFDLETRRYVENIPEELQSRYIDPYHTRDRDDLDWMKSLVSPNSINSEDGGQNMPIFQYGLLPMSVINNVLSLYNMDHSQYERTVEIVLGSFHVNQYSRMQIAKKDYFTNLKFLDSGGVSSFKDVSIQDTIDWENNTLAHQYHSNISAFTNTSIALDANRLLEFSSGLVLLANHEPILLKFEE